MRGIAALPAALLWAAACSQPPPPPAADPAPRVRELLDLLQQKTEEGGHGPHHRANNELQKELWKRLGELPPGSTTDRLLLDAAERVYTRYDANYYHGILWHWPYLCSRRAIELCDRILKPNLDREWRERALWIKAFALRCPGVDPWDEAERDLETYAEQRRWMPNYDAAREIYRTLAADFPATPRGKAAAQLAADENLSFMLPKGPKEPDPREP